MIIDAHVHVWRDDARFPWAPDITDIPQDATPEMLLQHMAANSVDRAILVQSTRYGWDNRFVADVLRRYPDKFSAVCLLDPKDQSAPDQLTYLTKNRGFHGLRLRPLEDASDSWFNADQLDPLLARAEALGVPILVWTRPDRLPKLESLLARHASLDVVIDHMAECPPDSLDQVQRLLNLAQFPRVYVKVSHTWSVSREAYPWSDSHGLVKALWESFGAKRLMWASDWPVSLGRASYSETLSVIRSEMGFFRDNDLKWILGETAFGLWPS